MNEQELGERIAAPTPQLYHVSNGLPHNEADREDAVQSAIEKARLTRILINECRSPSAA